MQPFPPINFLDHHQPHRRSAPRVRWPIVLALLVATSSVVLSSPLLRKRLLPESVEQVVQSVERFSFFHLAASANRRLQGEYQNRINILLMGVGGKNHEGGMLTDTIILASIQPETKKIALVSLPRDLVVPQSNGEWRKINAVHANSELSKPGSGLEIARAAIETVSGQPIPYAVRIDFDGFEQVIDELGGITIDVERELDDPRYPIRGEEENTVYEDRYEHLVIAKGVQRMDGALALKYARSRYARGEEGSDFARSRRQQKVLLAIRQELFSFSTIVSPRRLKAIQELINDHVATNFQSWELIRLSQIVETLDPNRLIHEVLDDSPTSPLSASRGIDGAYILVPKGGNFNQVHEIIKRIFDSERAFPRESQAPSARERAEVKPLTAIILNGTEIEGYASRNAIVVANAGLIVTSVGNAPVKGYEQTVIYLKAPLDSSKPAVERLRLSLNAKSTTVLPEWAGEYSADMIVVLGGNPPYPNPLPNGERED